MPPLDLTEIGNLSFEAPDEQRFPATRIAREAAQAGGAAPAVLNAANEVAVSAFLAGKIAFSQIPVTVERMLSLGNHSPAPASLDEVLMLDTATRKNTQEMLRNA